MYILGGLLTLEVCLALLAFIFSDELKRKVTGILQDEGIVRYRDDPDLRNFVDFVQEKVSSNHRLYLLSFLIVMNKIMFFFKTNVNMWLMHVSSLIFMTLEVRKGILQSANIN